MKNMKFAVLAFGLLGLLACFIPDHGSSFWDAHRAPTEMGGGVQIYLVMAGYVLATVMGAMGVAKGFQRPQGIAALVGFAFVLFKFRGVIIEALKHAGLPGRLMMISAIAGVVVSALALAKPEDGK